MAPKEAPKTPLVMKSPPKKIGDMTDTERRAFADEIYEGMAKSRKPAKG